MSEALYFAVSTGLKRVLGRELITDDHVAIFELVKNSFDADARHVQLYFDRDTIFVVDDGNGMSKSDIVEKWLFVAYSVKHESNARLKPDDFRHRVADRRHFAGSKGIGRFSTDRLGAQVLLQSACVGAADVVHRLEVDWTQFDSNDAQHFSSVPIPYSTSSTFGLPRGVTAPANGTAIKIGGLRTVWQRKELLQLKRELAKLINPFGANSDGFEITIIAPREASKDNELEKIHAHSLGGDPRAIDRVNGPVESFVFETLQSKATFVDVTLDDLSNVIDTKLIDRGEEIFHIREPSTYNFMSGAKFRCQLYFLNTAAKISFAHRAGIESTKFGSVFLFRNGFRVFPIGQDGTDWFALDRRKAQGHARFLGTREVIGRIDILAADGTFPESSSRDQGLLKSAEADELRECFIDKCLKRLEAYVVPVNWALSGDREVATPDLLDREAGRAKIVGALAKLIGKSQIELVSFSGKLIEILNERSLEAESSLRNLRLLALKKGDAALQVHIDAAEARIAELKQKEAEARARADEEATKARRAQQEKEEAEAATRAAEARTADAQREAEQARQEADHAKREASEQRKQTLFLASISALDVQTITDLHHQIGIYSGDIRQRLANILEESTDENPFDRAHVLDSLVPISLLNDRILAVSRFATKANFRMESELVTGDLSGAFVSYLENVANEFLAGRIELRVFSDTKEFVAEFKPIDLAIITDNLVSNARKARATHITFDLSCPQDNLLRVVVSDDGIGVTAEGARHDRLFERGFTTTTGSGLGLHHVRTVLAEMNGTIQLLRPSGHGTQFEIRIKK